MKTHVACHSEEPQATRQKQIPRFARNDILRNGFHTDSKPRRCYAPGTTAR
jgi:hypothetical protein